MTDKIKKKEPTKYKLLIEFIYKKPVRLLPESKYLTQNKPYIYGLKIKNIDTKASPEIEFKNLSIRSSDAKSLQYSCKEKFTLQKLNPNEEKKLWWPGTTTLLFKGEGWIVCTLESSEKNNIIETYQINKHSGKPEEAQINRWGEGILVRDELGQQQARTNFLILILTALVFLDGVWGLDVIGKGILQLFGCFFQFVGTIFANMSK